MTSLESIKLIMKAKKISMRDLAKSCGVSPGYVNGILNGHMRPSPEVAAKILRACPAPIDTKLDLYLTWSQSTRDNLRGWYEFAGIPFDCLEARFMDSKRDLIRFLDGKRENVYPASETEPSQDGGDFIE